MPRIRSVKPEFFSSLDIAALSTDTVRLAFLGLWTHVDDKGRCLDDARLIRVAVFPRDDTKTDVDLEAIITELVERGRVVSYAVDGKGFLEVVNWSLHQKISHPSSRSYPGPEHPAAVATRGCSLPVGTPRAPEDDGDPPERSGDALEDSGDTPEREARRERDDSGDTPEGSGGLREPSGRDLGSRSRDLGTPQPPVEPASGLRPVRGERAGAKITIDTARSLADAAIDLMASAEVRSTPNVSSPGGLLHSKRTELKRTRRDDLVRLALDVGPVDGTELVDAWDRTDVLRKRRHQAESLGRSLGLTLAISETECVESVSIEFGDELVEPALAAFRAERERVSA